jgi:hypothetical protein
VRGLQAAPFYGTLSTNDSREHAGRWAKAIYYAAGETSTAICSIAVLAVTRLAADTADTLCSPEAERFVQPQSVVIRIGRDHEMLRAVPLGGAMRSLHDEPRADPFSTMCLSSVDRLKPAARASDDDPAARLNLPPARVDGDEPRPAPRAEQRPQVFKAVAGEAPVRLFFETLVARGDL